MNCPPLKKIESSFLCSHELTVEYIMNCLTDCLRSSLMLASHFRLSYRSRMLQMFGLKYSISWRFILMLSSHLRQSFEWSVPFTMSQPQFCIFVSPIKAIHLADITLLDLIILIINFEAVILQFSQIPKLILHPQVEIFSPGPYSQTPSVYILSLACNSSQVPQILVNIKYILQI